MYRKVWFWLVLLLAVYTLAGFFLLPWWLQRFVPEQLEQRMGWQAQVEEIKTNPFSMSLDIRTLTADDADGEKVIGFDRLFVDLGFWKLFTGVVGLQAIAIEEPFIRLDLLDDYGVNFARDWSEANPAATESEPAEDDTSAPPKLYFQRITINGGELLFRDFSKEEPANFRISPLDLTLNDLATWQRDDTQSNYYLLAALGNQTIEWEGDLSINPLYSEGFIRVANIDHETLKHFLKPYLPYDLRGGNVTVSTNYELQLMDQLYLTTSEGELELEELAVALDQNRDDVALKTGRLAVEKVRFGLTGRTAEIGMITVDTLDLALERGPDGAIDLLAPLQREPGNEDDGDAGDSPGPGFQWSIAGLELADSRVQWRDRQPETSAEIAVEELALTLGRISDELEEPVRYQLRGTLAEGGSLGLDGQATLQPFTLEAGVTGSGVQLAGFEPYIREMANLNVRSGQLTLDGNLDLDGQQEPLTGTFSGTAEVAGLNLTLPDSDEPLLAWQTLRLAPLEYNVYPARLEIGTITLSEPAVNVVRGGDGLHNLERIIRDSGAAPDADAEEPPEGNGEEPDFIFRIEQLLLEEGAVSYTDRTLDPSFTTTFDELNGTVTGVSNVAPQQGKVSVRGRVDEVSELNFEGTLGTLGTDDVSQLSLGMKNGSLPNLSPYFGRYLGYGVDSGKLNVEMDYEIAGSRIDATNMIVMDRLELGQPVASDEAVGAPVKLGLALLRDRQGVIEIDLPISGNLDDPDFSVGKVVMRAFVNILAKAAASPFSVLGSVAELAGLSGEELSRVNFPAGEVALAEGERAKLDALADALSERPALLLNIRGVVAPEADGLALLKQRLAEQNGGALSDEAWEQAKQEYLAGNRSLPPEVLGNLASARGVWLRNQLLEEYDVADEQLFLLDPVRDGVADAGGQVAVEFALDAR
ncbi:DUF748 domain-containing protein [Marinobacter sp. GN3S48]|uniref:DUF748 domain-containing protein n=1 Tax=Marinobacter sp. GN3S48 TaxID=3382302 RepID=UPI00387AD4E9